MNLGLFRFWNCALISVSNNLNLVQVSIEEKSMVFLRERKCTCMGLTVSRIVLTESEFIVSVALVHKSIMHLTKKFFLLLSF